MKAFHESSAQLARGLASSFSLTEKLANACSVDRDEHNAADILTSG
jgi:hypothetical protein